jgi:hypothetical protein
VELLDDAIQAYERVTGTVVDRLPTLLNLGVALLDRGRSGDDGRIAEFCTKAVTVMEEHLLSNPQDARAHSSLGLALFTRASASNRPDAETEYRQASSEFRQALVLSGRSPELFESSLLALSVPQPLGAPVSRSRRYAICQILALVNDADHCLDEIEKLVDQDPACSETIANDPVFRTFLRIATPGTIAVPEAPSPTVVQ